MIDRGLWFLIPLRGSNMQRINTAYFYILAQKLEPLRGITFDAPLYFANYMLLKKADDELSFFLRNPLLPPITSYGTGNALLAVIQKITNEAYVENRLIQWGEPEAIIEALNHFEISLQSDFATRDTFIVSPKGAYSTTILAERGETAVSSVIHALVPSLAQDVHDGCRCLAFELGTSAAFHFFRAVEAAVCAYGEFVRKRPFTKMERSMGLGGYANCLKQTTLEVDTRIINSIQQIASLHRNPTMHPEMHISITEALATFGMTVSVIETLALDWTRRQTTPNIPLIDILPDDAAVSALLGDGTDTDVKEIGSGEVVKS